MPQFTLSNPAMISGVALRNLGAEAKVCHDGANCGKAACSYLSRSCYEAFQGPNEAQGQVA
ncbi:hypothetical protein Z950_3271 [Sulfitobacter mediterraneus KCTC 32188]|nr:hypothetical protein Z950_3271 [Sulfitobacter mediterraneus KCTC 32188]